MDLAALARTALGVVKNLAPLIPGGQQGVAAAEALGKLVHDVLPHADAPTAAELTTLRDEVNQRVNATIQSLGDG